MLRNGTRFENTKRRVVRGDFYDRIIKRTYFTGKCEVFFTRLFKDGCGAQYADSLYWLRSMWAGSALSFWGAEGEEAEECGSQERMIKEGAII